MKRRLKPVEEEVKMEEEWGVERQEVKLVMLMTIAKRAKAEEANDRARVGNVNRQERRDKWVGRSWGGSTGGCHAE